jgi:hypothetical protein
MRAGNFNFNRFIGNYLRLKRTPCWKSFRKECVINMGPWMYWHATSRVDGVKTLS